MKKNSILLVEAANHESAMKKAGPTRLRPIVMTTVAIMMSATRRAAA